MAAAKVKQVKAEQAATVKQEVDLTIYDVTDDEGQNVTITPPSFEGRLNLNAFAFKQPTRSFRRHRPYPKVEEPNSDVVKREESSTKRGKGGNRTRPLVLTPTPELDDTHIKGEVKVEVEARAQTVTAPSSEPHHVASSSKVEKVEQNSPLIAPIQSTEWDLPIITVPKPEPGQESATAVDEAPRKKARYEERVVIELEDSSPEPEARRSTAPTPSTSAPSRAQTAAAQEAASEAPSVAFPVHAATSRGVAPSLFDVCIADTAEVLGATVPRLGDPSRSTSPEPAPRPAARGMFAPPSARPAPSILSTARSPFFASASSSDNASTSKRKSDDTTSGSPTKKSRPPSSYQPPETYAHLQELADLMAPDLLGIFVGVNPGLKSAAVGHSYAGPSNRFWKLLHTAGITERRLPPVEDATLPGKYQMGNTNIVNRPTRNQMELSKHEMVDSVQALIDKVRKWKPESVVIVGKKVWEIIWSVRHGRGIKKHEFKYGWQDDSERMGTPKSWEPKEKTVDGKPWVGARVFVAASTSGAAAIPAQAEKERIWREFGLWVNKRREERGLTHYPPGPTYEKPKPGEPAARDLEEQDSGMD